MKLARRKFLHLAACAATLPAVSRVAKAQTYPSRPITMIVPFAAGGLTDVVGRVVAERMVKSLGHGLPGQDNQLLRLGMAIEAVLGPLPPPTFRNG
jgi:hypothetical protein